MAFILDKHQNKNEKSMALTLQAFFSLGLPKFVLKLNGSTQKKSSVAGNLHNGKHYRPTYRDFLILARG
jgi:hypothetical protein